MALKKVIIISAVLLPLATASILKGWSSPAESAEGWIPAQGYEGHSIPSYGYLEQQIPSHEFVEQQIASHGYEQPIHGYEEHAIPVQGYEEHAVHHVEAKPNIIESLKVKKLAAVEKVKAKKWSWLPSWPIWKGKEEIHEIPVIKETTHYPIWKIHKYKGIEVRPINVVEEYPEHQAAPAPIQQTIHTHQVQPEVSVIQHHAAPVPQQNIHNHHVQPEVSVVQHHAVPIHSHHIQAEVPAVPVNPPAYLPPYQPNEHQPWAPIPQQGWQWPGPQWQQPQVEVKNHVAPVHIQVEQIQGINQGVEQLALPHIDESALLKPFLGAGYSIETIQKLLPTFQKDPNFMDKLRLYTLKSGLSQLNLDLDNLPALPDAKIPVAVIPHPQITYPEYQPAAEYGPPNNEGKHQLPNDIEQSPIPYDIPLRQTATQPNLQQYKYAYPPLSDLRNSYGQAIPQDSYAASESNQVEIMAPPPTGVHAQKITGRRAQVKETPKAEDTQTNNQPENQQNDANSGQQDQEKEPEQTSAQQ